MKFRQVAIVRLTRYRGSPEKDGHVAAIGNYLMAVFEAGNTAGHQQLGNVASSCHRGIAIVNMGQDLAGSTR